MTATAAMIALRLRMYDLMLVHVELVVRVATGQQPLIQVPPTPGWGCGRQTNAGRAAECHVLEFRHGWTGSSRTQRFFRRTRARPLCCRKRLVPHRLWQGSGSFTFLHALSSNSRFLFTRSRARQEGRRRSLDLIFRRMLIKTKGPASTGPFVSVSRSRHVSPALPRALAYVQRVCFAGWVVYFSRPVCRRFLGFLLPSLFPRGDFGRTPSLCTSFPAWLPGL